MSPAALALVIHLDAFPAGARADTALQAISRQAIAQRIQIAFPAGTIQGLRLKRPIARADYFVTESLCTVLGGTGLIFEWATPHMIVIVPEDPPEVTWASLCASVDGWGSPAWIHPPAER